MVGPDPPGQGDQGQGCAPRCQCGQLILISSAGERAPWLAPLRCNHCQQLATRVPRRRSCCPPRTPPPPPTRGSSKTRTTTLPPGSRGSILPLSGIVAAKAPCVVLSSAGPEKVQVDQVIRLGFVPGHWCCASELPLSFALKSAESPLPEVVIDSFATSES